MTNNTVDNIPELIIGEIGATLKSMGRTKSADEKLALSQVVYNLAHSLGAFIDFIEEVMGDEDFEDYEPPSA